MLQKGERVQVTVEQVMSYGVFCRVHKDGSLAYIRCRELTFSGNVDPRQMIKKGDELNVIVHQQPNQTMNRLAELSWRRAQKDPWIPFSKNIHIDNDLEGTVKYIYPDRVIIEIQPGIDGIILLRDRTSEIIQNPEELVWRGDQIRASVLNIQPTEKKLQLSLRRRLERQGIISQVIDLVNLIDRPKSESSEEIVIEDIQTPPKLNYPGRILIAEDDPDLLQAFCEWLTNQGCHVDCSTNGLEALVRFEQQAYSVLISDINMPYMDGISLAKSVKQKSPGTICCILSEPNQIYQFLAEIEAMNGYFFAKPFDTQDLYQFLLELSQGQLPNQKFDLSEEQTTSQPFNNITTTMSEQSPLEERLSLALNSLISDTNAEKAILFHLDPITGLITIQAQTGKLIIEDAFLGELIASPVKSVITEKNHLQERKASSQSNEMYKNLFKVLIFESCIGVPVTTHFSCEHALFIFHRQADAFLHDDTRHVQTCAALIRIALEEDSFNRKIHNSSSLILAGQLSSSFNHEVYNKVNVLDLQVEGLQDTLREICNTFPGFEGSTQAEKLSKTISDIKQASSILIHMAEDFRQITRGGSNHPIDITQILQQACDQVKPLAARANINIILQVTENLPLLKINRFALIYVVYNLLLNAIQHMQNCVGERIVQVIPNWERNGNSGLISIRVSDCGPGVHHNLWGKIFEMGYTTRSNGSGLGLYIARSLVETLGGKIFIDESYIGSGTTFKIELHDGGQIS